MKVELSKPQYQFVKADEAFPAFVAGYGSGKTTASVYRQIRLLCQYGKNVAYYLPTYDLITQIAYPAFSEALEKIGLNYEINRADKVINVSSIGAQVILRTMDRPERIVGYEVAHSVLDELDTLPIDKAADVWRKVVARNRLKIDGANTIAVATTPEGFRFVYDRWKRNPMEGSRIINASTYSNKKNLPAGYIENLKATFPAQMLEAYLNGEFVNMTQGSVYTEYDRAKNATNETVRPDDTLHIGMDFNVGQMAAVVHVLREDTAHAVDEFVGLLDTPTMIAAIRQRYPTHSVMVYPDASGQSRKTVNASESDIALLRMAKFSVLANSKNPYVKDRVAAVNGILTKLKYFVNIQTCPHLVEGLEQQAYDKNGEPDKLSGLDHVNDAAGYFVAYRYPVKGVGAVKLKLKGL